MRNDFKTKIIGVILVAICIMTVGYSIVSSRLNISGISSITSEFNVRFSNITSTASGGAYDIIEPSHTNTTASFSTGFTAPGDIMVYEITIVNDGTLNAYLNNINIVGSTNPAFLITYDGVIENELLRAGEQKVVYVTIEFDRNITEPPAKLDASFSVTFDYTSDVYNVGTTTESCFSTDGAGSITGYNVASCGTDVVIPSSIDGVTITTIGRKTFYELGITSVIIPNTVTEIKSMAFYENELTSLILPDSVTTIGNQVFAKNLLQTISLSDNITSMGYGNFYQNQLPDNQALVYNRNSDGSINYASLNSYGGADRSSVTIPKEVTQIGERAFYACDMEEVIFNEGLVKVGDEAFIYNHLTKINLPSTLESIGVAAFNANNVSTADGPFIYDRDAGGVIDYTTIDSYAGARNENVVIPEGVTKISEKAFYDSGVHSITLPSTLEIIESEAFKYCYLTTITIPNTVNTIGSEAFKKTDVSNLNLTTIVNKTSKAFDWYDIVNAETGHETFITGPVVNTNGDVTITAE